jgi:pSer/pThr/pTyr-binding forkhead associated (FHA) protein
MTGTPSEPRLVAVTGVMSGEILPLAGSELTFGRDASNTICIPDAALSRHHCAFTQQNGAWVVRDLKSSNGTFVNGIQISTHALADGDQIKAGGSVFLFVAAEAPLLPPSGELV